MRLPRLRALRERKPMTQEELAAASGLNRLTIIRLEKGSSSAYPNTIRRLADALGVQPDSLYGDDDAA